MVTTAPSTARWLDRVVLALTLIGLAAGGAAYLAAAPRVASWAWATTTLIALLPLGATVVRDLLHGRLGVDLIALLAMVGALLLGETLAGAVIALMLSGGQALEGFADARARRELSALLGRAPREVYRYTGGELAAVPIDAVRPGDRLLVKPGEVLAVDGVVLTASAVLDESALTGESRLAEHTSGDQVRSGTLNAGSGFDLRAIASAEESTYAGIVRLVREAQASKAPMVRLADRYALVFLPLTLGVAGLAWLASGDPVRALAVLVVATPCPLILATPVAVVSGISRAAREGVIVKGGGALEALGRGRVLLLDKTGTVTSGTPSLTDLVVFGDIPPDELLRLAASLDQVSPHVLAGAIVRAARERELALSFPEEVTEELGAGIQGVVEGRQIALGKGDWLARGRPLPARAAAVRRRTLLEGSSSVFVAVDGEVAGALLIEDPLRADAPRTIRALKRCGFERIVLVTGDHLDLAETVGAALGVDDVLAERSPADKVDAVRAARAGGTTVMVGDGINDAPALAAADVGVAMGARGATASSEAADVVLVRDRLDRLAVASAIARRSRGIALQSIFAGMGLSVAAMGFAAAGLLAPVAGALLQEVIDVAVIANALRALTPGRRRSSTGGHARGQAGAPAGGLMGSRSGGLVGPPSRGFFGRRSRARADDAEGAAVGARFRQEHRRLLPEVNRIRDVADRFDQLAPAAALAELTDLHRFLVGKLLPHEEAEDATVYPVVARLMGGEDPTGTMSREHQEIAHLVRLFTRLLEGLPEEGPTAEDLRELRRVLYGLHAILRLHFAQEEESYLSLIDERLRAPTRTVTR